MNPAICDPAVEVCCESGSPGEGWIWFRCAYDGCHPGVGHIIIESKAGDILYDDCPTESTRKLTWLDFPGAAKLWEGGLMQVNYGLPGCSGSGHRCNRATFEWGSYEDTANPLGVAYLDNAGGPNDRGNVCDGAALTVWRSIAQGGVPDTSYIESSPPWGSDQTGNVGASTFQDHILGPYNKDYWIFSGNLAVDDDLMIDGVKVFEDGWANQVGGGNVFLKFLPKGGTARLNAWNAGGWTGASGSLRLYSSGGAGDSSSNLSRCNAFIIPPNTIGAIQARLPVAGQRKVCYRRFGSAIVCDGMPTGDRVFEITKSDYEDWAKAESWAINYSATGGEVFNSGADGDFFTSSGSSAKDSVPGCVFSAVFNGLPCTTNYYGSAYGWPAYPGTALNSTFLVDVAIRLGISAGRYYAGVTLQMRDGGIIADSSPSPGRQNNGTFTVTVGGYVIPMQARWSMFYTENLGASNNIVWKIDLMPRVVSRAMAACPDALRVPSGYKPKITGVSVGVPSGPLTATARFSQVIGSWPEQVPLAKRALVGAGELWSVKIFRNGGEMANFSLTLFFPSEGYQGGMIEVGAAINYTDYYTTEVVSVGQNAALSLVYTPYGEAPITLALQVDMVFIPL